MKKTISILLVACMFTPALAIAQSTATDDNKAKTTASLDVSCATAALQNRESALQDAFKKYTDTITALMKTRTKKLIDALALPTAKERSTERKKIERESKTAARAAQKELRTTRAAVRNTYKSAMKQCSGGTREAATESSQDLDTPSL